MGVGNEAVDEEVGLALGACKGLPLVNCNNKKSASLVVSGIVRHVRGVNVVTVHWFIHELLNSLGYFYLNTEELEFGNQFMDILKGPNVFISNTAL